MARKEEIVARATTEADRVVSEAEERARSMRTEAEDYVDGKMIVVGAAPEPIEVSPFLLIGGRRSVQGWPSGTSVDSEDTLSFSALFGIRPMIETMPLERAPEAYEKMMSGNARFRMVITTGQ